MIKKLKIVVVGLGYVGLANAIMLAQHNSVIGLDIDQKKINKLKNKISPIEDADIEQFLTNNQLDLSFDLYSDKYFSDADFIVVATPTDYDYKKNNFDTSSVEQIIERVLPKSANSLVIIKSTIPLGFTKKINNTHRTNRIIFSPEFLREGFALHDNLYPSRIIVTDNNPKSGSFLKVLKKGVFIKNVRCLKVPPDEAEAIKLFSNTYLAMRIAFFNELDSFALKKGLNTKKIIDGVSLDPRIGKNYNNPSFGYGGYCLPKDTKQLLSNYRSVPQSLIKAVIKSNEIRQDFISKYIAQKNPKCVGIFRLVMKKESDNIRESSLLWILKDIKSKGINVIVYEPLIREKSIFNCKVIKSIKQLKSESEIILTNRFDPILNDVKDKVFTRDVFGGDI